MPTDKNGKNENNNDAMNLTRLFDIYAIICTSFSYI